MTRPAAGLLDTRVVIESRTLSQDALGGPVETWSTFATVWARVRDRTGWELARQAGAPQTEARRVTEVTIRWLAGVDATMRCVFAGRTMQVKNVAELGRREAMTLLCEDVNG